MTKRDCVIAFLDGKEVQFRAHALDDEWQSVTHFSCFDWEGAEFRQIFEPISDVVDVQVSADYMKFFCPSCHSPMTIYKVAETNNVTHVFIRCKCGVHGVRKVRWNESAAYCNNRTKL